MLSCLSSSPCPQDRSSWFQRRAADERLSTAHLDAFRMAAHAVTNAEYARFVRETGYRFPRVVDLPLVVRAGGPDRERAFRSHAEKYTWIESQPPAHLLDHPVTLVLWDDAVEYCRWLADVMGQPVRLPSEAEWEKAARGGLERQRYPWGDRLDADRANFLADPATKDSHGTRPCRTYRRTAGLFDMSGNAWQWVNDWHDAVHYAASPATNPRAFDRAI